MKANPFDRHLGPEDHLCRQILDYCRWQHKDLLIFHVPNEGRRTPFQQYKNKITGVISGAPDFILVAPGGRVAFMEVKIKGGKNPTKNQKDFLERLDHLGAVADVVKGFDQAQEFIDRFMCPPLQR